jgi:hypothetical protein
MNKENKVSCKYFVFLMVDISENPKKIEMLEFQHVLGFIKVNRKAIIHQLRYLVFCRLRVSYEN